jgi:hypothetical protein
MCALVVDTSGLFTSDIAVLQFPGGCMVTRQRFFALALLAVLVSTPHGQTQKPEILWQFEAGG